jgi:hypothetical protein
MFFLQTPEVILTDSAAVRKGVTFLFRLPAVELPRLGLIKIHLSPASAAFFSALQKHFGNVKELRIVPTLFSLVIHSSTHRSEV